MESEKEFRGQLPAGLPVVFYPRANLKANVRDNNGPVPAIVVWCDENGLADLTIFQRDGSTTIKRQVYPWNDRILIDELSKNTSHTGYLYGCWAFTEWSKEIYEHFYVRKSPDAEPESQPEAKNRKKATQPSLN